MIPKPVRKTFPLFAMAAFVLGLVLPAETQAQFVLYTRAIPQRDTNGVPVAGANTTFADGTVFQPDGNVARSTKWAWRPYGDEAILSSLGNTTPPAQTKELVTTVSGLKPGTNYSVKVLFWHTSSGTWGIRAGLTYANGLRTNPWFTNTSPGVVLATLLPWETMPSIFYESGRNLYAAPLGNITANSSGQIKVYVHDLPTIDANLRTWYQGVAVSEVVQPGPHAVDLASAGTPFHRGVRGHALADPQVNWGEYWIQTPRTLEVARGSSIRGVSTGLAADRYDWRTRNGQPRPTTLEFLRYSRDYQAELFMGVNMRGLIEPNPEGGWLFYDTNATTLATVAADWVRYVNHIVPTYRQGDTINDTRDAAIVNSLVWSSTFAGDTFDKLLRPGEAAVPHIDYWEIGNEPTVGVTCYSVSNSFTMEPADYHQRYKTITQAIKAEDPTVKVGPTLVNGTREADQLAALVSDPSVPIDFITYHPYERMGVLTDPAQITGHLGSIYARQLAFYQTLTNVVAENGRSPGTIEYATTEVNVSYWDMNDKEPEARMAHALGTVETVFTHARLGLVASHYWIGPVHPWDGTEYPIYKAYQKLRDHMGDTLVSVYAAANTRLYTTRDSRTGELAVWVLNFSNDQEATVDLQMTNLPRIARATLLRLEDVSGTTTLFSANLSSYMTNGPSANVDWTSSDFTGQNLSNFQLRLPAATLSLLVMEPGLDKLSPSLVEENGAKRFSVTFRRLPHAANVRYKLFRSDDLKTWQVVSETRPGQSDVISISDNTPIMDGLRRFYRVGFVRE